MFTVHVQKILPDRILVTRESARMLEHALREEVAKATLPNGEGASGSVVVDFAGVAGVAPSFLDELLSVLERIVEGLTEVGEEWELIIANPPMRLSLKFEAIARGHRLSIQQQAGGSWRLSPDLRHQA